MEEEKVRVSVSYCQLSRESLAYLENAIQQWAEWHESNCAHKCNGGQVSSGRLECEPLDVTACRSVVWHDVPSATSVQEFEASCRNFNILYEQTYEVPRYDRSFDRPLDSKTQLLPNGLASQPLTDPRRNRSGQRCFNCSSYAHSMKECWKQRDKQAIEEARRELSDSKRSSLGANLMNRYYADAANLARAGEAGDLSAEFPDVQPGVLGKEVRTALGIGELDPPPWLGRMHHLGIPPAYNEAHNAADTAGPASVDPPDDPTFLPIISDSNASCRTTAVQYPGFNAPIPPGANAQLWAQVAKANDRDAATTLQRASSSSVPQGNSLSYYNTTQPSVYNQSYAAQAGHMWHAAGMFSYHGHNEYAQQAAMAQQQMLRQQQLYFQQHHSNPS